MMAAWIEGRGSVSEAANTHVEILNTGTAIQEKVLESYNLTSECVGNTDVACVDSTKVRSSF